MPSLGDNLDCNMSIDLVKARNALNYNQTQLASKLGWSTYRNVSKIENGKPMELQTELAIECLLRRERKWPLK